MLLINLFGGPGSGKSTGAAALFAGLKNNHIRAELVHEAAKRFIYKGATAQLDNQVYLLGKQWSHIRDLERAGCDVAISDSPLICNMLYGRDAPYPNHKGKFANSHRNSPVYDETELRPCD